MTEQQQPLPPFTITREQLTDAVNTLGFDPTTVSELHITPFNLTVELGPPGAEGHTQTIEYRVLAGDDKLQRVER